MRIGQVLSDARERAGLDIRDVEEQTKIRVKYLHALEDEDWGTLPSPAYAKGFLRTYAQLLGLDAEALVDEFRRQVEGGRAAGDYPLGDQVLARSSRPGGGGRSPWLVAGLILVAIAAVLLVIGLTGGDDGGGDGRGGGKRHETAKKEGKKRDEAPQGTVTLGLEVRDPVEVCLLGGGGEELIDGQVLAAGATEEYERREFELRFPSGFAADQLRVQIAGRPRTLPKADGPAAYRIVAPKRVEQLPAPDQECP
jgi:hypothetical protein